jgi:predicted nucleic-acid-binding Zn-ribbon protein
MKCPKCQHPEVLVEDLGAGSKKIKCPKCGLNEIRDKEGRKLLTGDTGEGRGSGRLMLS